MHQCTSTCPHTHFAVCAPEELTHDASFSLYNDILLLAGREAGPERWLLFTEPAPTLKEAQLDFLRFLLHGIQSLHHLKSTYLANSLTWS